jgi:hypothetical protein
MADRGAVSLMLQANEPGSIVLTEKGSMIFCDLLSLLGRLSKIAG